MSPKALKRMNQAVRDLNITRSIWATLPELAKRLNPKVRGWIAYYGAFYPQPSMKLA
ncbi:MAG: RNA-directed DNA polymerase [Gammaproteobacteria bacterium]